MASENLTKAKKELEEALGSKRTIKYFEILKKWFKNKSTKEEFDRKCRNLMPPGTIQFHNKFLLALLNKIDAVNVPIPTSQPTPVSEGNVNESRKRKLEDSSDETENEEPVTFEPFDVMEYVSEDSLDYIRPSYSTEDTFQSVPPQRYMVQELFLPDAGFIMGRLLVGAWECGLNMVDDAVAEYISTAVQVLLKNLVTAIILKRKHYKVTGAGSFFYDVGASIKNPYSRNTVTRQKIDDSQLELDKEITSPSMLRPNNDETTFLCDMEELYPIIKKRINVRDVLDVFQDRNIIPSHRVYSTNMERLSQMLHY